MFSANTSHIVSNAATPIYFPQDSIVPYYGSTNPALSDWDVYSLGINRVIMGTTSSALVGTTANALTANWSGLFGSTGAHTGSVGITINGSNNTGSTFANSVNNSAGSHNHGTNTITFSSLAPKKAQVILLKANKQVLRLPANSLCFRDSALGSYGDRFNPSTAGASTVYLENNSTGGNIVEATIQQTETVSSTSGGTHQHHTNNRTAVIGSGTPTLVTTAGSHAHSVSVTLNQSIMDNTKILHAWISASTRIAKTDVVVMYTGDLANLPAGWMLCDGLNGTINMNSYYLAYDTNNNVTWNTIRSSNLTVGSLTQSPFSSSHNHSGGSTAGGGILGYHGTQSWDHSHTVSTASSRAYTANRIFLYFIQYKGI